MPLHFLMLVMFVNTFFAKANYLSKFRLSRVTKYFLVGGVLESYFRHLYM